MALTKVLAHSTNPVSDCDVGERRRRVDDRAAVVVAATSSSSSIAHVRARCRARRRRACRGACVALSLPVHKSHLAPYLTLLVAAGASSEQCMAHHFQFAKRSY